jgi:hypothetical protein
VLRAVGGWGIPLRIHGKPIYCIPIPLYPTKTQKLIMRCSKSTDFCNEDLLVDGSQTYRYFSCGGSPKSQPPLLASAITTYGASSTPAAQEASNVTPVAEPPTTPTSAASSRDEAGSAVQVSSTATAARSSVAVQSSSAAEPGQDIKLAGVLGSVVLAVLAYL